MELKRMRPMSAYVNISTRVSDEMDNQLHLHFPRSLLLRHETINMRSRNPNVRFHREGTDHHGSRF